MAGSESFARGRIHVRRPNLISVFLLAIGRRTIHCPEGVPSPSSSQGEWTELWKGTQTCFGGVHT